MKPVYFKDVNSVLGAPNTTDNNTPECEKLPVHTDGECCISLWELDDDDLAAIAESKAIFLTVMSGRTQHPVSLSVMPNAVDLEEYKQPNIEENEEPNIKENE